MSGISELTLAETEEKMATRQDELRVVMEEAKADNGEYNYKLVKSAKDPIKSSTEFRDYLKKGNDELDELGKHAEALREIKSIADQVKAREETPRGFTHPHGGGGPGPANRQQFKSLGERVTEAKGFKGWAEGGKGNAFELKFEEDLPSDFLARAGGPNTIGSKALMTTTAGMIPESVRAPGFVEAPTRPIQLVDILPMGRTSQNAYPYLEETTRNHNAAETAEGATFSEDEFAFTEQSAPVRKITTRVPVTDEQMEDMPAVEGYINNRIPFSLLQRLDQQCGVGDGTGANLRGLFNTTGLITLARVAGDNVVDTYYKGMVQVRLQGRAMATQHLAHPTDWEKIRLLKTDDGVYIYGSPDLAVPERMWGLPVVQYEPQGAGRGLTGSFMPTYIELIERRGIDIQVGFVDAQFAQGRKTIRGDMRVAFVVSRPSAFADLDLSEPT